MLQYDITTRQDVVDTLQAFDFLRTCLLRICFIDFRLVAQYSLFVSMLHIEAGGVWAT